MDKFRFLVLDGQLGVNKALTGFLSNKDFVIFPVNRVSDAVKVMNDHSIDVAVVELEKPAELRLNFLRTLNKKFPEVECVVLDSEKVLHSGEDKGKNSEYKYLSEPFTWKDVEQSIRKTKSYSHFVERMHRIDEKFRNFSAESKKRSGLQIIGKSEAMKNVVNLMSMIAEASDTSVLLTGESGTGKELVARGIHLMSKRCKNPFYAVNCSAIPDSLFESEFFGYRKGAFTGAVEKSEGWFELANRGTLFLDEITELPSAMQPKFLRILDDKVIQKIGSHQEIRVDVRIISATNQDLQGIKEGNAFRKDLFHRLNSFRIHIPPLRERKEDIPLLLDHFIAEFSAKMNKPVKPVCQHALEKLMEYSFPGNVRELKNMAERAIIMSEANVIKFKDFCLDIPVEELTGVNLPDQKELSLIEIERMAISEALARTQYNKTKAAKLLGISRQALDRKMERIKM